MKAKYAIIGVFVLGCSGSEFSSKIDNFAIDAEGNTDSGINADAKEDTGTGIDAKEDTGTGIDAKEDTSTEDVTEVCQPNQCPQSDYGTAICNNQNQCDFECEPGCSIVNQTCYCPEPQCCGFSDCPGQPGEIWCKSGKCTTNMDANCNTEGCNTWCIHCYGTVKTYRGSCVNNACECHKK